MQKKNMPKGNEHWEQSYSTCDSSAYAKATKASNFSAKSATEKPKNYVKVNKTDH
tara:strand:+ start:673 stop:837 length:165 start_codon:yes stop_codon:yes gene_type:complete